MSKSKTLKEQQAKKSVTRHSGQEDKYMLTTGKETVPSTESYLAYFWGKEEWSVK